MVYGGEKEKERHAYTPELRFVEETMWFSDLGQGENLI